MVCIGTAKFEKGRYQEAADLFKKALDQDFNLPDVHYDLANCYMKLREEDRAIQHYQKAIEVLKPMKRMEYFYNLGNALSLKTQYSEAINQYKLAVEALSGFSDSQKKSGPLYFNMGNAYYFLKDYRKATEAFNSALLANPTNKDYHFNMANTCVQIEKYEPAIYHFKNVIELDEAGTYANTMASLMSLANIYLEKMQDQKRAHKVYKKLFTLFPDSKEARQLMQQPYSG